VEQIIRRYGISFVERRGVLLFDITDFSLFSPFEQASQLNSLSYSMNSAYNKLSTRDVHINFARTTTGDGYYVWNRDCTRRRTRSCSCSCCWCLPTTPRAGGVHGAIRCR
jgi:hypothetical protein